MLYNFTFITSEGVPIRVQHDFADERMAESFIDAKVNTLLSEGEPIIAVYMFDTQRGILHYDGTADANPGPRSVFSKYLTVPLDFERAFGLKGWAPELDSQHRFASRGVADGNVACSCGYVGPLFEHVKDEIRRNSVRPIDNPADLTYSL